MLSAFDNVVLCSDEQNVQELTIDGIVLNVSDVQFKVTNFCGAFGQCIENRCVCDEGWSTSQEWDFFISKAEDRGLLCDTHTDLLKSLLLADTIISFCGLLFYFYHSKNWIDTRMTWVMIVALLMRIVHSLWRFIEVEERLFGIDTASTILQNVSIYLMFMNIWLFIKRYIKYEKDRIQTPDGFSKEKIRVLDRVNLLSAFSTIGAVIVFTMILIVPPQHQRVMMHIGFSAYFLATVSTIWASYVLLGSLLREMNTVIIRHTLTRTCPTSLGYSNAASRSVVLKKMKLSLPKMKLARKVILICGSFFVLMLFPTFFSAAWVRAFKYVILLISIGMIASIITVDNICRTARNAH